MTLSRVSWGWVWDKALTKVPVMVLILEEQAVRSTINGLDVEDSRCVKERLEKTMLTGPESFDDIPNLLWCCHTH